MTVAMAQRMQDIRASEIRELLKLTARPEVISFAGGLPAAELFPVRELVSVAAEVLLNEGGRALQYSTTEGCPELRGLIADRMASTRGAVVTPDQVLITAGSQQALDLTGKLLLDPGDVVLCESPTYVGAISAFRAYRPRFVEVDTDDDGMRPADLARQLRHHPDAKLLYAIPDFQNPTGRCWSVSRRRAILALAREHGVPVVEDAPYAELRFAGEPRPSLLSLEPDAPVIYLGTFSKVFCPGLRLGWVCGPQELVEQYVLLKQGADLHTSTLSQRELCTYLQRYDLDAAIHRIRDVYRTRRDAMLAALDTWMPPGVRYTRPDGGLFVWVELPPRIDARELLAACLEQDVAFVPGGGFFPGGGHPNTARLNFSAMPEDRIAEGVRRIAEVLHAAAPGPAARGRRSRLVPVAPE